MSSDVAADYGYDLFKQVARVPYHYTEERTFQNRVLFSDAQRRTLFHLRQQLTIAFISQAPWQKIQGVFNEMAGVMKSPSIDIPEEIRNEMIFTKDLAG